MNKVLAPIVASNFENGTINGNPNVNLLMDISENAPTLDNGAFQNVTQDVIHYNSRRFQNVIMCSGQKFPNASTARDAMYLMSLSNRFRYYCKRNSYKHIIVTCTVNGCPWKITHRVVGASNVVKVHTFINGHSHTIDDVVASQPFVRPNCSSMVIDEVIRSTLKYQPRQICKDFIRENGMRLTYCQAWKMMEKAKDRIYGQPNNY